MDVSITKISLLLFPKLFKKQTNKKDRIDPTD